MNGNHLSWIQVSFALKLSGDCSARSILLPMRFFNRRGSSKHRLSSNEVVARANQEAVSNEAKFGRDCRSCKKYSPNDAVESTSDLNSCDISHDGTLFISGGDVIFSSSDFFRSGVTQRRQAFLNVYEFEGCKVVSSFRQHVTSVQACALTNDGTTAASGDFGGVVCVWETETGRELCRFNGGRDSAVSDLDITPMRDKVISVGGNYSLNLWDVNKKTHLSTLMGHVRKVRGCSFSSSVGASVISCSDDGCFRGWDTRTGREKFYLSGCHNGLSIADCDSDMGGNTFVTCGLDSVLRVWDARKLDNALQEQKSISDARLHGCAITPDGARVVASGEKGTLLVWDVRDERMIGILNGHSQEKRIGRCSISRDGTRVVSASRDKTSRLFELNSPSDNHLLRDTGESLRSQRSRKIVLALKRYLDGEINMFDESQVKAFVIEVLDIVQCGKFYSLEDIYHGHLLLRTISHSSGGFAATLNSMYDVRSLQMMYYENMYHKLHKMISGKRRKIFAKKLLFDAVDNRLVPSVSVVFSIIGDAMTGEDIREEMSKRDALVVQIYAHVRSQINSIENRLQETEELVQQLRVETSQINQRLTRQETVNRYKSLVKFGLSLIPIAGAAAMAFTDGAVEVLMSLDLECVVGIATNMVSEAGQTAIDLRKDREVVLEGEETSINNLAVDEKLDADALGVRLVQLMLSEEFQDAWKPEEERDQFIAMVTRTYHTSIEDFRSKVNDIALDYREAMSTEAPGQGAH